MRYVIKFFPVLVLCCTVFIYQAFAAGKDISLKVGKNTSLGTLVVADGKSPADGVLVISHGTLAHKDLELIKALQTGLSEKGISTLAFNLTLGVDQRKGMYDCAVTHTHKHEDAVTETKAWIDWLKKQGAKSVSLLGHSRGGNQAALFASKYPDEIDSVVLMAPATIDSFDKSIKGYKGRYGKDIKPYLEKARQYKTGAAVMELPGFIYCANAKASAEAVLSYYEGRDKFDTKALLQKSKKKALIIAATKDMVVPNVVEHFKSIAGQSNVKIESIEDADHMFLDFFAEDAVDKIEEFLKSL